MPYWAPGSRGVHSAAHRASIPATAEGFEASSSAIRHRRPGSTRGYTTIRTRARLILRPAVLLATLALVLAAVPVRGATSVEIEVRPLLGGRYAVGGWVGITVGVTNDGAPTSGYVSAQTADGTVRSFLELPGAARKAVTLYLRPEAFQRSVTVVFEDDNGSVHATADVAVLEQSTMQVAVVGDGAGGLRAQLVDGSASRPDPISIVPADLPGRPEPLDGLATIVWAADSTGLTDAQRDSLERWVSTGGQLVVIGGPDWQARASAFIDLLPVEGIAGYETTDLSGFAAFTGEPVAAATARTAASGTLRDGASVLIAGAETEPPLLTMTTRGAGRVIYSALDLSTDSYRGWAGAPALWSRLIPNDAWIEQFFGGGMAPDQERANLMGSALGNLPALDVPPAELLLVVVVGYIALIGPISYLVLRRMDRRELAWLTAPALVVIFTACSYGIGNSLKGSDIILNQISLVRVAAGSQTAAVESYAGLFSPSRDTYDLTVEADALVAPIDTSGFEGLPTSQTEYLAEQGNPAHLRGLEVGVYGFQALRADAIVEHAPSLEVEWRVSEGDLVGTVTNIGSQALEDVAVVAIGAGELVGDLEPGEASDFTVGSVNFNGSSTSEQIYGFGGFDAADAKAREINLRRQVIDSLVGYSGIPGRALGLGAGLDRGPFVIGWRTGADAAAPLAIEVDGHVVQEHHHVVEIVSGRPLIGGGTVNISPSQMSVQVLSTEGDASVSDPAFVSIGQGEVVFAVSVPLEMAELQPSALAIVAGPDPSMVLQDQGAFGGFFPQGFVLSVRDAETGEWRELGDLSQAASWDVDDPASVMDQTGRIEVRVVGSGIDANFGQTGVWVSAEMSGELPQ
jgi:hypothetical protein